MQNGVPVTSVHGDGRILVASTVVEYAVQTYGPATIPILLDGLTRYDSWQTLIPAVYGVSATQFERAWLTYVQTHYSATQ